MDVLFILSVDIVPSPLCRPASLSVDGTVMLVTFCMPLSLLSSYRQTYLNGSEHSLEQVIRETATSVPQDTCEIFTTTAKSIQRVSPANCMKDKYSGSIKPVIWR
jgi:hypothetical protein